jgi:hypothetical protein
MSYKLETFSVEKLRDNLTGKEKNIVIPPFQRSLAWTKNQEKELIKSIRNGYPFGSILLFEYKDPSTNKTRYQLIDGLQRSNTIVKYSKEPLNLFSSFMDENEEIYNRKFTVLEAEIDLKLKKTVKSIKKEVFSWLQKNYNTIEKLNKIQYSNFSKSLFSENKIAVKDPKDKYEIQEKIDEVIEIIMEQFVAEFRNFIDLQIPALVFTGKKEDLHDVFEKINTGGKKLSKYEIFAATWLEDEESKIKITDPILSGKNGIIDFVNERYSVLTTHGYDIDPQITQNIANKELEVFDVIFGFGKMINDMYPNIFKSNSKDDAIVASAFSLVSSCLSIKNKEMEKIPNRLAELENKNLFFSRLLEVIGDVNSFLDRILIVKTNSKINKNMFHSELQMVSIIASVFFAKYGTTIEYKTYKENEKEYSYRYFNFDLSKESDLWDEKKKLLKFNLDKRYVVDILQEKWGAHGDQILDTIVFDRQTYYYDKVEWDEFSSILDKWFNNKNLIKYRYAKEVKTPDEQEKIILSLVYYNKLTVKYSNLDMELDHIVPKMQIEKWLNKFNSNEFTLPIGSLGNISLLPGDLNSSKRDKIIYDSAFQENLKKFEMSKFSLTELEDNIMFTKKEDFNWIQDKFETFSDLEKGYSNFIKNRFTKLKNIIKEEFFKDENDQTILH